MYQFCLFFNWIFLTVNFLFSEFCEELQLSLVDIREDYLETKQLLDDLDTDKVDDERLNELMAYVLIDNLIYFFLYWLCMFCNNNSLSIQNLVPGHDLFFFFLLYLFCRSLASWTSFLYLSLSWARLSSFPLAALQHLCWSHLVLYYEILSDQFLYAVLKITGRRFGFKLLMHGGPIKDCVQKWYSMH